MNKPLIGISGDFRAAREETHALSWFNTGYYDSVTKAGGLPILIPPYNDDDDLKQIVSQLDGIVLAGCSLDLDPVRMGLEKHPAVRPMPLRREDFDRRLCKLVAELKMPILAIGSGMQTLNVIMGGTLIQHLPELQPKPLPHYDPQEPNSRHVLEIVPDTRMDTIYGPGEIRVNSQHHMAVDQVAPMFRVSATCPDGVIEAYESIERDWFCLGTQFHPENDSASALDMQVFEAFLDACHAVEEPNIIPMPQRAAA
jgi:putative glutamine amidotransferase